MRNDLDHAHMIGDCFYDAEEGSLVGDVDGYA